MADFIPIRTTANNLINIPIVDGQIVAVYDTGEIYIDKGNSRQRYSDVYFGTYSEITGLLAPLAGKLYFATDTHKLLQAVYSGSHVTWQELNSSSGGGTTGDWGTKVVVENGKTSIQAVPNITHAESGVRGNGAVDLQMFHNNIHDVASGMSSFAIGRYNSAKGNYSNVFGSNNNAKGDYSTIFGGENTTSGQYSSVFGNQNVNKIDGVVCNNNTIPNYEAFTNVSGNCGFKGIKCSYMYNIPIWKLALTDVLIAKVHIIAVDTSVYGVQIPHQIQNIIVSNCELIRNEIEFSCGQANEFDFAVNNGKLYIIANYSSYDYQIGIFYTLYSQSGAMDSSCSSSSGSGSSSSSSSSG
ncbi:MAG: hypothetical protein IK117_01550 [Bacteroidales bacterium]|nr:hypothetical protein [Bacteroidales bacterium]